MESSSRRSHRRSGWPAAAGRSVRVGILAVQGDVGAHARALERLDAREEGGRAALEHAEAAVASLAGLPLRPERRRELEQLARFSAQRRS